MGVTNGNLALSPQLELLLAHANEAERFGAAEKYFYELSRIPGYALRMEAMLQVNIFTLAMFSSGCGYLLLTPWRPVLRETLIVV
jgi:hypothetical protein